MSINAQTGSKIITGSNGFFINLKPFEFRLANNSIPEPSPQDMGPFQFLRYAGIPTGKYEFREDGISVADASDKELAKGIEIHKGSSFEQYSQLRQAIIAKNKLYFYRWRPQNVTYLFGFRKHEQGNNAIEIPKFDPLIEAKEKEIAKLRVPREHVYELVPVKEKKK